MKNFIKKIYEDRERLVLAASMFAYYYVSCKIASYIGDKYFPRERYMSDDFWNWKPK